MTGRLAEPAEPGAPSPLWVSAALQDHLLTAQNDLDRLQALLADACATLMQRFCSASQQIDSLIAAQPEHASRASPASPVHAAAVGLREQLGAAVVALQFEDMAAQLIEHTTRRLRCCADQLADRAFGADDDGGALIEAAPQRPNPVTQAEMDAGSVELF